MIENIQGLPGNVLGLTAKGRVTANDYESVVVPTVEELFKRYPKNRFLYHLGDQCSGFESEAVWDDIKLGLKHFSGWERLAIVSDVEWIRSAIRIFGLVMPGDVRVFHNNELDEAKHWITE